MVVAAAAVLVYANSSVNGFVWDDYDLLVQNPFVHSLRGIPHLFSRTYWRDEHLAHGTAYRPLVQLSFAVEHALWGVDPMGYHVSNVVGHVAASIAVLWLLSRTPFATPSMAFLGALLFALHPVHAEAVNWLKNRSEIWGLVWLVLAWGCFCRAIDSGARLSRRFSLCAGLCFLAAMMTKEATVFLPALITLYCITSVRRNRRAWALCLGGWIMAAAFAVFVMTLGRDRGYVGDPQWQTPGVIERVAAPLATLWEYVRLFAVPGSLCVDRGAPWPDGPWLAAGLGLAALAFAVGIALWLGGRTRSLMGAGWAVFVIALLPQSNILPIRVRPIAEQRLYIPSVGLCVVLSALIATGHRRSGRARGFLALCICVSMAALTVWRGFSWHDMRSMAWHSVRAAPSVARMRHNLARGYDEMGFGELAAHEYDHALTLKRHPMTLRAAGVVADRLGRFERAAELLEEACRRRSSALNLRLLAKVYLDQRRTDEALRCLEEALTHDEPPADRALTLSRLGDALLLAGRMQEAADAYARALRADPTFAPAARAYERIRVRLQRRE